MVKYAVFGHERDIDIPRTDFPSEAEMNNMESNLPGCEHGWFDSVHDGLKLHYRKFLPPSGEDPKAIVIWMHGIQTHCGRGHVLEEEDGNRKINMSLLSDTFCAKQGYAVYAFDMIGHGYSEGHRFYVPNYEIIRDDYISFIKLVCSMHEEGTPLFLSGESFGAMMTLHVAKYFQEHLHEAPKGFNSVILLAPAVFAPAVVTFPTIIALEYLVTPVVPRWRLPRYVPNPVKPAYLWRDPRMLYLYSEEKRVTEMLLEPANRHANFGTVLSLLRAITDGREHIIPGLEVPIAVVHGTDDKAVPIEASEFLLSNAATPIEDIAFKRVPGAYHDLLADPATDDVIQFMTNWIQKRLSHSKSWIRDQQHRQKEKLFDAIVSNATVSNARHSSVIMRATKNNVIIGNLTLFDDDFSTLIGSLLLALFACYEKLKELMK